MQKHNRFRIILTIVFVALVLPVRVFADPKEELSIEFRDFFQELGQELVPNLQTASVMNHELGSAQLGDFPRMYFSLSMGATLDTKGVLNFTKEDFRSEDDNESLLAILLGNNGLEEGGRIRNITDQYLPLPSMRAGFGVGLAGGWELSVQAGIVPQAIASFALGFAPESDDVDVDISGVEFNITTVGTRIRRVLVAEDQGIPAISAGLGYVYSGVNLRIPLDGISVGGEDNNSEETLTLEGSMDFVVRTHSFGADIRASRKFLRVFYPFIGISSYYQFTDYYAGVSDFDLRVGTEETTSEVTDGGVKPVSSQDFHGFNTVINAGFDIKLAVFNLFLHGNYALNTRAPGAIIGMRLQF